MTGLRNGVITTTVRRYPTATREDIAVMVLLVLGIPGIDEYDAVEWDIFKQKECYDGDQSISVVHSA